MSTDSPETELARISSSLTDTKDVDPDYQASVVRAKHAYVAMTELALMGVGVMEHACVEAFDLSPEAIAMAYIEVTTEGRVQAAPVLGARWTKGPNMYPLSAAEIAMRYSILSLATMQMPQSEFPHHPIYQQTSDSYD